MDRGIVEQPEHCSGFAARSGNDIMGPQLAELLFGMFDCLLRCQYGTVCFAHDLIHLEPNFVLGIYVVEV